MFFSKFESYNCKIQYIGYSSSLVHRQKVKGIVVVAVGVIPLEGVVHLITCRLVQTKFISKCECLCMHA